MTFFLKHHILLLLSHLKKLYPTCNHRATLCISHNSTFGFSSKPSMMRFCGPSTAISGSCSEILRFVCAVALLSRLPNPFHVFRCYRTLLRFWHRLTYAGFSMFDIISNLVVDDFFGLGHDVPLIPPSPARLANHPPPLPRFFFGGGVGGTSS